MDEPLSAIPTTEHFALITRNTRQIYHEGDERSRTNPGHGYPAYTETVESIKYQAFETEEALAAYIGRWHKSGSPYRVLKVTPLRVTTSISVSVTP